MRHINDIEDLIATPLVNHLHSHHVANGPEYVSMAESCVLDEQCRTTLERVREIVMNLDQVHLCHRSKLAKDTKLGSRHAPIGEDNYLHMTRSNLIMQNGGAVSYITKDSIIYPRSLTVYGNEYTTLGGNTGGGKNSGGAGCGGNVTITTTTNSSPNSSINGGSGNSGSTGGGQEMGGNHHLTTKQSNTTVTLLRQSPNVFSP